MLGNPERPRLVDSLRAQLRFVQHLNHDPVRVGAVKGRAAVTMDLKRVNDRHALRLEFVLQLFDPLDGVDHEAQMIELLFRRARREVLRHFMERNIVAAGGKIHVLGVRLPDNIHAENILIEALGPRDIS